MNRILLADDSPQALRLAEQILAGEDIEIVSVTDGATALRRLGDVNPDLLITDVYLPTKSGFDLARFLKSQPQHRHMPSSSLPGQRIPSMSRMREMLAPMSFCGSPLKPRRWSAPCASSSSRARRHGITRASRGLPLSIETVFAPPLPLLWIPRCRR